MAAVFRFFKKLILRAMIMLGLSLGVAYYVTGLNPLKFIEVAGGAPAILKNRLELVKLQKEFNQLDPEKPEDFAKIEALLKKQKELQGTMVEQVEGDDIQMLQERGEKMKALVEKLQSQTDALFKDPRVKKGRHELNEVIRKVSHETNEFYSDNVRPYLEKEQNTDAKH